MQTGEGLITKIFSWIGHPYNSSEQLSDWAAFFVLALIASYLWSTVIREID
jgi:hypothetical protein